MPQSAAPSDTNAGASVGRTMTYSTPGLRMMRERPGSASPVTSRPASPSAATVSALSEPFGTAMRSGRAEGAPPAAQSAAAAAAMACSRENAKPAAGRLSPYDPIMLS